MRPCIRCCAAIGNADQRCPVCGAPQTWPGWRAEPHRGVDLPPESEVEEDDGEWLVATVCLLGLAVVGLSVLAFGSGGVFVAMGLSVLIALGLMTSGCA